MRYLLFVFLFVVTLNIAAQSPAVSDLFAEGTKHANAGKFDDALKSYSTALSMAESEYVQGRVSSPSALQHRRLPLSHERLRNRHKAFQIGAHFEG